MTAINNIIRAAIRKPGDKFHIITCGFDGYYENMLAKTGNTVYVLPIQSRFEWRIDLPPKEKNCIILPDVNDMPVDLEADVILCQERRVQYPLAFQLAHMLHIPLVCVEHFLGLEIPPGQRFDAHISTSNEIAQQTPGETTVIPYGIKIPTNRFNKNESVVIIGNFTPDERNIVSHLLQGVPNLKVIGNNPGLSNDAKTQFEYDLAIRNASIYINLSLDGRITNHLLRAMASECVIISNDTPGIRSILNKDNSIICTSAPAIISAITKIKKQPDVANTLTIEAKQTVSNYTLDVFTSNLNLFLEHLTANNRYTRAL